MAIMYKVEKEDLGLDGRRRQYVVWTARPNHVWVKRAMFHTITEAHAWIGQRIDTAPYVAIVIDLKLYNEYTRLADQYLANKIEDLS